MMSSFALFSRAIRVLSSSLKPCMVSSSFTNEVITTGTRRLRRWFAMQAAANVFPVPTPP